MPFGNSVSWGRSIAAHVKAGRSREALQSFWDMAKAGVEPDKVAFVSVLKGCANITHLHLGKLIHFYISHMGFHSHLLVSNSLINMYGKCGCVLDAHRVLAAMPTHDVVSWTTLIVAYAQYGRIHDMLALLCNMCLHDVTPNRITITTVLNALHTDSALSDGMCIHALVIEEEIDTQLLVGNCIISMYNKCGSLNDALHMLQCMRTRNVVSWNIMIAAYAQQGHIIESLNCLLDLGGDGFYPDKISFVSIFKGCNSSANLRGGMLAHAYMVGIDIEVDVVLGTSLVEMYGMCGSVVDARAMFDSLVSPNVISWTSVITVYSMHGLFAQALEMFQKMLHVGIGLDKVVFVEILNACGSSEKYMIGKLMHSLIIDKGFEQDVVVGTNLITMYGKCACIEDAKAVFAKLVKRNVFSWTAMIQVCARHSHWKDAFQHFEGMQADGLVPNAITCLNVLDACASPLALEEGRWIHMFILEINMEPITSIGNALVNMYSRCGSLEDAFALFGKTAQRDVVSWTSILCACAEHGQSKQAFEFFDQMLQLGKVDKVGFLSIFDVCGKFAALELGSIMHAKVIEGMTELDPDIMIGLVNMYNKCGSLEDSKSVFDVIPEKKIFLWSSLIAAYSQHGLGEQVIHLVEQMKDDNIKLDDITFVSILSACSHTALVGDCIKVFDSMRKQYGLSQTQEHYVCVVDLLGRVGALTETDFLITSMPFQPNAMVWMAFLGACRLHNDMEYGRQAAEHVLELDPSHTAAHIVLSNIHAAAFKWDLVEVLVQAVSDSW